jgi:spore germination protein KB
MTSKIAPFMSVRQLKVLVIFFIVGDIAWFLPSLAASIVQQDAWIATIIGSAAGWGLAAFIFWFGMRFPGKTLVDIHREVAGKWIGGLLSLFFIVHMMSAASAEVRAIGQFVTTQIMMETPMRVILFVFSATVVIALFAGLEAISLTAQVFFLLFVALSVLLLALLTGELEFSNLLPVLNHSPSEFARSALMLSVFPYGEMTAFLMIFPAVKKEERMFKHYLHAVMWGGLMIILLVTLSLLSLGAYLTEQQLYPTYTMAKKISIGDFLQRLEFILVISYVMSTFFKCAILIYAAKQAIIQLFKLRYGRAFIMPVGFLMFGFSYIMAPDIVFLNSLAPPWSLWSISNLIVIVGLVYLLHLFKSRQKKAGAT